MGHWKVDVWTEEDNLNKGKIMEKEPLRHPGGVGHEVSVLLSETEREVQK